MRKIKIVTEKHTLFRLQVKESLGKWAVAENAYNDIPPYFDPRTQIDKCLVYDIEGAQVARFSRHLWLEAIGMTLAYLNL